jgi:hypothetical protein
MDDCLSPSAILDLAVLGITSERARSAAEVIGVVKRVGGTRFQPTTDVIAGRIAALADASLLTPAADDPPGGMRWRPSASGRAHVERLRMSQSAPPRTRSPRSAPASRSAFSRCSSPKRAAP